MVFRRRCPICRSRQWHKEPASGLITCSEGHVLQNYVNETTETTEFGPHSMRKRTLKSSRKEKEKESRANPILYHGERARYHYFQCLQLLLRKQIKVLTELWKLPPEFEVVCRDTWALKLSILSSPPPATSSLDVSGDPEQAQTDTAKEDDAGIGKKAHYDGERHDQDSSSHSSSSNSSSSTSSYEEDEDEDEDPDLVELLRQNSETEHSDSAEDLQKKTPASFTSRRKWQRDDAPIGNLAILVFTCWTLRIPVMYCDLLTLIDTYALPYLDPVRLLPESLTRHLTKHTNHMLSPHFGPTTLALHSVTSRLAKKLHIIYGIFTPEVNAAPLLWRAVRSMGGNPTLYMLTKALASLLEIPLTLNTTLAPKITRVDAKPAEAQVHIRDNVPPEVALVASVIMVLKMIYGFEGKEWVPGAGWEAASSMPSYEFFLANLKNMDELENQEPAAKIITCGAVLDFEDNDLDKYLDFCERALLPGGTNDNFPMQGSRLGREGRGRGDVGIEMKTLPAGGEALERGGYRIYGSHDVMGELPEDFKVVLERGARIAGVRIEELSSVVEGYEGRGVKWKRIHMT